MNVISNDLTMWLKEIVRRQHEESLNFRLQWMKFWIGIVVLRSGWQLGRKFVIPNGSAINSRNLPFIQKSLRKTGSVSSRLRFPFKFVDTTLAVLS
jgi:hypothetical protein